MRGPRTNEKSWQGAEKIYGAPGEASYLRRIHMAEYAATCLSEGFVPGEEPAEPQELDMDPRHNGMSVGELVTMPVLSRETLYGPNLQADAYSSPGLITFRNLENPNKWEFEDELVESSPLICEFRTQGRSVIEEIVLRTAFNTFVSIVLSEEGQCLFETVLGETAPSYWMSEAARQAMGDNMPEHLKGCWHRWIRGMLDLTEAPSCPKGMEPIEPGSQGFTLRQIARFVDDASMLTSWDKAQLRNLNNGRPMDCWTFPLSSILQEMIEVDETGFKLGGTIYIDSFTIGKEA